MLYGRRRAEEARVEELLWLFRSSVRHWSEQAFHAPRPLVGQRTHRRKAAGAKFVDRLHGGRNTSHVDACGVGGDQGNQSGAVFYSLNL